MIVLAFRRRLLQQLEERLLLALNDHIAAAGAAKVSDQGRNPHCSGWASGGVGDAIRSCKAFNGDQSRGTAGVSDGFQALICRSVVEGLPSRHGGKFQ
jgi:hypothetical protein